MELAPGIAKAIEAGDTVIAASARAARALRRLHGEIKRRQSLAAWQAADILDWDSWLNRLWQKQLRSGSEKRLLLSALQEQQIWSELVRQVIEGRRLISVLGVSELAQEAWALLCSYRAFDVLRGAGFEGLDVESFRGWARDFQRRCNEESWLSRGMLPLVLGDAVVAGKLEAPGHLVLIGFDRVTPAQQYLIEALRERGCQVEMGEEMAEVSAADTPTLVNADDGQDEIATCALWVKQALDAGKQKRIAVVVPSVAGMRPDIERIFRQILAPHAVSIGQRDAPLPFEFSLGVPLAQMPMVRAALQLLRWMQRALPQEQVSWLMLSGFVLSDAQELLSMAKFDARLRGLTMRHPEQELDPFLRLLNKEWSEAKPLGDLRRRLIAAKRLFPANGQFSFAEWADRTARVLEELQWPGMHALASPDFQVQARWSQLLDDLSALAFDGSRVDCAAFLEVLEQQANRKIFSPESLDAQVQIMGPFEAAGLSFDALWFLGATDENWPAVARPHPFLSQSLQRQRQMPHANSDVDWKLAQQVTRRLTSSATRCVFSYAEQNAAGACRPSTLLSPAMPRETARSLRVAMGAKEDLLAAHDFPAVIEDEEPSEVVPWPTEMIAGGADVLGNQAACAFRSFASRRLAARAMEETDWGLDPRSRGTLVHTILENLWAELKNRDRLIEARNTGSLAAIVARHVDEALQRFKIDEQNQNWNQAYLSIERTRNIALIEEWLDYEVNRADFAAEAREEKRTAAVGSLLLQVRVDRVDAVSGGRVIIDYKTGVATTDGWEGPRPDQPQLPIYAGYGQVENLKGVLLAKVSEGKATFAGQVEDSDAVMPGQEGLSDPPYSEKVLDDWRRILLDLANQFLRGEAQVDPKRYPQTCAYCKLPGLCRVAESEHDDDANGTSDGNSE